MGVELSERDIFAEPLSEEEVMALAAMRPLRELFSFRSPSFRKLGLDPDSLSDDEMLSLMMGDPRLVRRPLVVAGGRVIVGNDPAEFERVFGREA